MEVRYEKNLNHGYLMIRLEQELEMESYQIRMLLGGGIKFLLPSQIQTVDGKRELCYDITGKESLAVWCRKGKLKEEDLQTILQGIMEVVTQLQAFLMDGNQLLLQPEYIYWDFGEEKFKFCYLPGYGQELQGQFIKILEYLLPIIDHDDPDAVSMGYGIYRQCLEESFSMDRVKAFLYKEKAAESEALSKQTEMEERRQKALQDFFDDEEEYKKEEEEQEILPWSTVIVSALWTVVLLGILGLRLLGYLTFLTFPMILGIFILVLGVLCINMRVLSNGREKARMVQASIQWPGKKVVEPKDVQRIYRDEDFQREKQEREEYLQKNGEETAALGNTIPLPKISEPKKVRLVSQSPQELSDIELMGDLTVIGKQQEIVDVVIPLPTISRVHAKIRRMEEEYYLMDLNSTNGTCLNGKVIPAQENCRMNPGDQIVFADAEYIFAL